MAVRAKAEPVTPKTEGQRLLQAYFASRPKLTQAGLAKRLKRSSVQVHKWLSGKNVPDVVSASRLQIATRGAVPVPAWSKPAKFLKAA
jgi:hypothetical protein